MGSSPSEEDLEFFKVDPAAPLKDIVVCCTSIPPDQRTEINGRVSELGGVHKYDLTPDVTHLIVGDYDTAKYRHVARERPDVHAMDAAWIEALSELWKRDEEIDFLVLEKEHRLKAFERRGAGGTDESSSTGREPLLICLTGFGDQRDEIAEKITQNGGSHTGDLTRQVTHLVVNKPEGKKYSAAKSWGIRTVTLEWLYQSIERGMILEETKFDPLIPAEKQGLDAWKKENHRRTSLGKRSRSSAVAGEGQRKLRKTASMKLSSQRNTMWGDILGRKDSTSYSFAEEKSEVKAAAPSPEKGIFASCVFFIHGFSTQRRKVLEETITPLDGVIVTSLDALNRPSPRSFLIVPQSSQPETHPQLPTDTSIIIDVVTEFYIERCLHNKRFFDPRDEVLGKPFPVFPIDGFADLRISTAAFTGIDLSQVARSVAQLGATYDEYFKATTSVVVCRSLEAMRKEKLRLALDWGVPIVSADWLWECISTGYNVPIGEFIFPELRGRVKRKRDPDKGQSQTKPRPTPTVRAPPAAGIDPTAFEDDKPKPRPRKAEESTTSADFITARTGPERESAPLSERSSASLNKSPSPTRTNPPRTKSAPLQPQAPTQANHPTDGGSRASEPPSQQKDTQDEAKAAKAAEQRALSSKITSLLAQTTSLSSADQEEEEPRRRKTKILGRAVSNVSAASSDAAERVPTGPPRGRGKDGLEEIGGFLVDREEETEVPDATQLGYSDPKAREHKAAAMRAVAGKQDGGGGGGRSVSRR